MGVLAAPTITTSLTDFATCVDRLLFMTARIILKQSSNLNGILMVDHQLIVKTLYNKIQIYFISDNCVFKYVKFKTNLLNFECFKAYQLISKSKQSDKNTY